MGEPMAGDSTAPEARSTRSPSDSSNESVRDGIDTSGRDGPDDFSEKRDTLPERFGLSRLAIPLALLVGGAITGGTTYALVSRVQNLIANASVDGDKSRWLQTARTAAYDACYYGCNDCSDPSFAYNACQLTAQAKVKGIICAGEEMWNWAAADRYPEACLMAVAQLLMGVELERVKQSYRNQLAIIVLTVLGGVVGGVITYVVWRRLTTSKAQQEAAKAEKSSNGKKWSICRPAMWKDEKHHHHQPTNNDDRPLSRRSSSSSSRRGSQPRTSLSSLATATTASLTILSTSPSGASAYPCTGHEPAWNQFFVSPNGTIAGVLHGWLGDCYDRRDCDQRCSTSCSSSGSGSSRSCSRKCTTSDCHTIVTVTRTPKEYVDAIVPRVRACGFTMVDALAGSGSIVVTVAERVGNPRLERDWWVRVSVNGLNVTRGDQTDDMVLCLHGIGG
ncbi:uncharacterized protein B0T15DRAFT_523071 [Chaetomium strumarium]|uniref:Uncharacterized protein n=1 Tax=Chaetomium strumarium TaxID=1170767 RepID=A0AAJ0GXI1_9PEZI|nr:hypothetical protein B0T15DRAFT_523071 [Chaetomium strumarium]